MRSIGIFGTRREWQLIGGGHPPAWGWKGQDCVIALPYRALATADKERIDEIADALAAGIPPHSLQKGGLSL